jgi:6-phosphogluconolactonase
MKSHQFICPTPDAVAVAFAAHFQKWVVKKKGSYSVALSGGSTPKLLFQHLAEKHRDSIPWEKVHFFWGDERCVPPDDAASNFKMTAETLLRHIDIPQENIHRIRGEAGPVLEAERYAAEILEYVPIKNAWPAFDLVMLGMGEDGHTASIFPHQMELLDSTKICAVAAHPLSGQQRITLTGKVINKADKVAFLITGHSKQKVLKAIREKTGHWETYPAAHIRAEGDLYWFLDASALA